MSCHVCMYVNCHVMSCIYMYINFMSCMYACHVMLWVYVMSCHVMYVYIACYVCIYSMSCMDIYIMSCIYVCHVMYIMACMYVMHVMYVHLRCIPRVIGESRRHLYEIAFDVGVWCKLWEGAHKRTPMSLILCQRKHNLDEKSSNY